MALDFVTHDEGPQSLKSNFYHKVRSKLKKWFFCRCYPTLFSTKSDSYVGQA